jgi:flagellar biosynthesis/type III secretory pathway M-ring protein FliF/YscJ
MYQQNIQPPYGQPSYRPRPKLSKGAMVGGLFIIILIIIIVIVAVVYNTTAEPEPESESEPESEPEPEPESEPEQKSVTLDMLPNYKYIRSSGKAYGCPSQTYTRSSDDNVWIGDHKDKRHLIFKNKQLHCYKPNVGYFYKYPTIDERLEYQDEPF